MLTKRFTTKQKEGKVAANCYCFINKWDHKYTGKKIYAITIIVYITENIPISGIKVTVILDSRIEGEDESFILRHVGLSIQMLALYYVPQIAPIIRNSKMIDKLGRATNSNLCKLKISKKYHKKRHFFYLGYISAKLSFV